jgi:AraC-like DNA-binding protein
VSPVNPEDAIPPTPGLSGGVLRRVLDHIDANCDRGLRLSELSALAHMSVFHFARLFKQSTGMSPHHFVVGRRIELAKQLLSTGDASIFSVAQAVGFRTASHFTTVFHRWTGQTPSAYRTTAQPAPPSPESPVASVGGAALPSHPPNPLPDIVAQRPGAA